MSETKLVGEYPKDMRIIQRVLDDLMADRRLVQPRVAPYGAQTPRVDQQLVEATTAAGVGEEFTVAHDLRRTPIGCILVGAASPVRVYDGTRANWSPNRIVLRADAANVAVRLIVL